MCRNCVHLPGDMENVSNHVSIPVFSMVYMVTRNLIFNSLMHLRNQRIMLSFIKKYYRDFQHDIFIPRLFINFYFLSLVSFQIDVRLYSSFWIHFQESQNIFLREEMCSKIGFYGLSGHFTLINFTLIHYGELSEDLGGRKS